MTNPTAAIYPVGTRVRCASADGPGFEGLLGTVTGCPVFNTIQVKWDNPPSADVNPTGPNHGGVWSEASLQILDNAEVDRLNERLKYADARIKRRGQTIGRLRGENEELNAWVAALQAENTDLLTRLTIREENTEAAQYERDAMASVLLYAFEHMDASARQRVFGFWDAVMA